MLMPRTTSQPRPLNEEAAGDQVLAVALPEPARLAPSPYVTQVPPPLPLGLPLLPVTLRQLKSHCS